MATLSVIVITKNEAANLKRCLESVSFADEIIVLDSGSTDETLNIAQAFTEHVYQSEDWKGYGVQKQRVLEFATSEWVLNIDADESLSESLKLAIQQSIMTSQFSAYRIPIQMNFYGKPLPHSSSPTRHIRLYRRQGAYYSDDIVHEKILLPEGSHIGQLRAPLYHHSFQDVSHALYKINRYSSYTAHIRLAKREKTSFFRIVVATYWMFFRCFILQRGFLDGKEGLLMAVFKAQGTFYRGIKQLYPDAPLKKQGTDRQQDNNWNG